MAVHWSEGAEKHTRSYKHILCGWPEAAAGESSLRLAPSPIKFAVKQVKRATQGKSWSSMHLHDRYIFTHDLNVFFNALT